MKDWADTAALLSQPECIAKTGVIICVYIFPLLHNGCLVKQSMDMNVSMYI